jgi:AhpD family alkylhydroperoxidase
MTTRIPLPEIDRLDERTRLQLARRPPLSLYRMVAHAPGLLAPFMTLVAANFADLKLPARTREALILRVAMHHQSGYEAHHHRRIAREAGLDPEIIEAVLAGATSHGAWDEELADAVALADNLLSAIDPPDRLVSRLTTRHGHRGYVEMVLVVGFYRMVAMFIAATGITPEAEDVFKGWQAPPSAVDG